jgi:hypothetical protein
LGWLMIHVRDSLPLDFLALLVDELGVLCGEAIYLELVCLLRSPMGRVQGLEVAVLVWDVGWVAGAQILFGEERSLVWLF